MKLYGAAILYDLVTPFGKLKMIGEVHGPAAHPCNLAEFVQDYTGEIWCELERMDATLAAAHAVQLKKVYRPLDVCALHAIVLEDDRFKFVNVRRRSPFYILESVLHLEQFSVMFCPTLRRDQRRLIKRFEKDLSFHMRSRKSTMQLLNALLSNDLPVWYNEYVNQFQSCGMRTQSADFHVDNSSILQYAKTHWTTMVLDNEVYSAAMADYESTRETGTDAPMVLDKYERELRDFFVKLFAVLMDVHILSKYMRERPKEVMIVAGVNHISRMIDFLTANDMIDVNASTVCVSMSEGGGVDLDAEYIDTSVKHRVATVHMRLPVDSPLNAFRERRAA